MALHELQRAFQARILTFTPGIEPELTDSQDPGFEPRLDAYVDGYRLRLVEALGATYPVVQRTLGEEAFARNMRAYIDAAPSRYYSVRAYGAEVAQHLSADDVAGAGRRLGELARWEWLLADVFDAPDDEALAVAALAAVPPAAWPDLPLRLRACVRRFETSTNSVEWWRAANDLCEQPPALIDTRLTRWLLWRRGTQTLFRSLDELEASLLDAVGAGATFGELCARLAESVDAGEVAGRAAVLLRGWISEELLASDGGAPAGE